jgi:membrane protein
LRHLPFLLRRTVASGWQDRVLGLSAEAAFWQMLSLPSLFLALIATLGYVSSWFGPHTVNRTEAQIESALGDAFSHQVTDQVIHPMIHEILHGGRVDVISIGFALALWAGSSATATFVNTITIAYGMRDLRGAVHSRLLALGMFIGAVLFGVILLPMLVLGPQLLRRPFPDAWQQTVRRIIEFGYYPVLIVLLFVGLSTFYRLAPPRRLPWHRGAPGAILAILIFLGGSVILRAYIRFILDHNHAYGALATPIAALLYFFVLALGVLLGAEFNAAIEHLSPSRRRPPRVLHSRGWREVVPRPPDDESITSSAQPEPHSERPS